MDGGGTPILFWLINLFLIELKFLSFKQQKKETSISPKKPFFANCCLNI